MTKRPKPLKAWEAAAPVMGPETEEARALRLVRYAAEDRNSEGVPNDWFRHTRFVRYDPATGAILASGAMSLAGLAKTAADTGQALLAQGGDAEGQFVDLASLTVTDKTPCPATLTGTTLTGVPVPSTLTVAKPDGTTDTYAFTDPADTTAEFTFDLPGTYTVTVESVPHLPGVYTITV